jgi:hypothetical protein
VSKYLGVLVTTLEVSLVSDIALLPTVKKHQVDTRGPPFREEIRSEFANADRCGVIGLSDRSQI